MVDQDILAGKRCFAFCGIARPESFRQTLARLGVETVGFQALPDHHVYHGKQVRQLIKLAEKEDASCFLCTEKDMVKLHAFDLGLPLYGVTMKVDADPALDSFVLERLTK